MNKSGVTDAVINGFQVVEDIQGCHCSGSAQLTILSCHPALLHYSNVVHCDDA